MAELVKVWLSKSNFKLLLQQSFSFPVELAFVHYDQAHSTSCGGSRIHANMYLIFLSYLCIMWKKITLRFNSNSNLPKVSDIVNHTNTKSP